MSFFKDFKADFAQAVNELIPDSEEMTSEYDDEDMVNTFDEEPQKEAEPRKSKKKSKFFSAFAGDDEEMVTAEEDFQIAPEDLIDDIDEMEAVDEESAVRGNEQESEAEPEQEISSDERQDALESGDMSEDSGAQMSFDFLQNAMEVTEPEPPVSEESVETAEEIDASYYGEETPEKTDEPEQMEVLAPEESTVEETPEKVLEFEAPAVDAEEPLEKPESEKVLLDSVEFSAGPEEDDMYIDTFSQTEEKDTQDESGDAQDNISEVSETEQTEALAEDVEQNESDRGDTGKEDTAMVDIAEEKSVEDVSVSEEADTATTYITKGTKITGDVETEGSIDIIGAVVGNVICKGKLVLGGSVQGNVSAGELYANAARIEGDVTCEGSAKIGVGSVVVGKVSGTSAVIAGAVNGDIDVHGPVIVDSTAVIMGNIKSKSVQINNGAVIEGFCSQCYSEIDVKSFFA